MSRVTIQARDRSGTVLAARAIEVADGYAGEQEALRRARRLAQRWIGATAHVVHSASTARSEEHD